MTRDVDIAQQTYLPLPCEFYDADTTTIAKQLLGTFLIHTTPLGTTIGKIVETEAYITGDKASHAFRGQTPRNKPMFGPAGYAYVYVIYGRSLCLNVVTATDGVAEAVLLRALEPVEGLTLMQQRRPGQPMRNLTNGPAKLTQAMGIDLQHNNQYLGAEPLFIASTVMQELPLAIASSPRIGISQDQDRLLRFYIQDNPFVSPIH